ncbi:MAG: hypothetical protein IKK98_02500, partial [Oscillospiraceae bacterium]|nr:hypothetical protein [Oscillospiraceae bacterium]
ARRICGASPLQQAAAMPVPQLPWISKVRPQWRLSDPKRGLSLATSECPCSRHGCGDSPPPAGFAEHLRFNKLLQCSYRNCHRILKHTDRAPKRRISAFSFHCGDSPPRVIVSDIGMSLLASRLRRPAALCIALAVCTGLLIDAIKNKKE